MTETKQDQHPGNEFCFHCAPDEMLARGIARHDQGKAWDGPTVHMQVPETFCPRMTETKQDQPEPEPNTQLSDYGKLMRARFEVADKYADEVLPPAFAKWFRGTMRELLDRDWNYFGAVDSLVVNAQIPFVNDIGTAARAKGLLTDAEVERTRQPGVSR